ncbi:MAG: hypothetical protein IJ366_09015 [Clostridia bacterium]|nr:hypothetical protein [Clostridia bacterium]
MNTRISYLKNAVCNTTDDIDAYGDLSQKEYACVGGKEEIYRKSHFLSCFAEKIPVVIDENELICGSMRFWRSRAAYRNKGHIIVDYRMILHEGICGIKEKISKLDTVDAKAFDEAIDAFSVFIERYAKAAEDLYKLNGNNDMKTVAENCYSILKQAPDTFHRALQLVWFVHLFLHAEGMAAAVSFGRFDDYMYPLYKKDIENGTLTYEKAKELLMCFWLKTCEGDESQNLTVGGDIENELTLLCLEVTQELTVQQPSISVRINDNTSETLWQKMIDLVKCKIGMPSIFNDNIVIKSLKNLGISDKDAKNYAIVGCYEANPDGNAYGCTAYGGAIFLHQILLEFLDENKAYTDYDEFYSAFKKYFWDKYNTDILEQFRKNWTNIYNNDVSPFESICMGGCLNSGLAAEHGGCDYTMFGINILGIGTLTDSIYVIKKLVFEQKQYGYSEFINQVKNNFPDRALAERCRNMQGKYGTDNTETNELAKDLSLFISGLVENGEIAAGVIPYAGLFIFLADVHSHNYPATPDGRLDGERLSYGIAASDLCVGKTVTSMLNSAANIANDRFADGNPNMFSISEKDISGEKGDEILKALIKGYFQKGGFHLQINVTDAEILKKAQEKPDEYRDLIVRISGYSEYFTRLHEDVQTALIERS